MDVMEAIQSRIEIREFADTPVSGDVKKVVLEAGRLSPSGRNLQHWRYVLIDAEELDALAEVSPSGRWVADADFAVVVITDPQYDFNELDAGRAVTAMQLAAWEHGVGSRLYTVNPPDQEPAKAHLEIPPEYHLTAVLGFGYPVGEIRGRKDRKALDEVADRGAFGAELGDLD